MAIAGKKSETNAEVLCEKASFGIAVDGLVELPFVALDVAVVVPLPDEVGPPPIRYW